MKRLGRLLPGTQDVQVVAVVVQVAQLVEQAPHKKD